MDGSRYFKVPTCRGRIARLQSRHDGGALRSNPQHVYFAVPDLDTVFARARKLGGLSTEIGDAGLPMGEIARRPWGELSFYVDDPWGNPLCFVDESSIFKGPSGS